MVRASPGLRVRRHPPALAGVQPGGRSVARRLPRVLSRQVSRPSWG